MVVLTVQVQNGNVFKAEQWNSAHLTNTVYTMVGAFFDNRPNGGLSVENGIIQQTILRTIAMSHDLPAR